MYVHIRYENWGQLIIVHTGIFCAIDLDLHACHEVKLIHWVVCSLCPSLTHVGCYIYIFWVILLCACEQAEHSVFLCKMSTQSTLGGWVCVCVCRIVLIIY